MATPLAAPMAHPAPDTQRTLVAPVHEEENIPVPLVNQTPKVKVEEPRYRIAHQAFYESLETLANEDPRILSKYISKYATFIQESDPETAIDLFKIARRVKG
jgi:hypothetical protein